MPTAAAASDKVVRDQLIWLLREGNAHVSFDRAIAGVPKRARGVKPAGLPYSPWMLLEHLRIAQWDIYQWSRSPKHATLKWPGDYWPKTPAPPSDAAWTASIAAFRRDARGMQRLIANPKTDLHARIPWGEGQTILREALVLADHNAYHIGQLIVVRRLLGVWKG